MKKHFWLVPILLVGLALRFYHNLDISLWHDEAFSALLIRYPWGEMFYRLGLDVHPPAYYVALRLWHYIFGDSMLALRGFSVLFGVLTVWVVWLFVKQAFKSEKTAIFAALLAAVNPYAIQFSTEARMYTFGAFFAVLSAYFLAKALNEQREFFSHKGPKQPKRHLWDYLWFALCTAIAILTHYYLLFTAVALGLYGVFFHFYYYRFNFKRYGAILLSFIVIILPFLPWLKTFIAQVKSVGQSYWIPPMDIWSLPGTFWTILLGIEHNNANPVTKAVLILVVLFSIFVFYRFVRRTKSWEKWLVLLCALAPFIGALMFLLLARLKGSHSSVYEERYFLFGGIFFSMALSVWLSQIKNKYLSTGLFAVYALFNLYAFGHYWAGLNISQKPGMGGAAKFLGANVEPGQHVFLGSSFEFFNYKYYQLSYYHTPTPPLLFTGGRADISQMSSVEGLALLVNSDLAPDFSQYAHTGDTEWLIWTRAFGSNKPVIPGNWIQVDEKEYPDVRPYVGTTIYVTEYRVK